MKYLVSKELRISSTTHTKKICESQTGYVWVHRIKNSGVLPRDFKVRTSDPVVICARETLLFTAILALIYPK